MEWLCVQYRSGLYSVQCASVQCTVTHFPETLASPRCLGQHSRQPGSARPGVSWPRAGPRLGKFGEFGHLQLPAMRGGGASSVSHSQTWSGIQEYFAGTGEIASAQEEPGYWYSVHGLLMSLSGVWTLAPRVSAILWLFDGSRPGAGAAW